MSTSDALTEYHRRTLRLLDALSRLQCDLTHAEPDWKKFHEQIGEVWTARHELEQRAGDLRLFDGLQPSGVLVKSVYLLFEKTCTSIHAAMTHRMLEMICKELTVWIGDEKDRDLRHWRRANDLDWRSPTLGLSKSDEICRSRSIRSIIWQRIVRVYSCWADHIGPDPDVSQMARRMHGWVELSAINPAIQRNELVAEHAHASRQRPTAPVQTIGPFTQATWAKILDVSPRTIKSRLQALGAKRGKSQKAGWSLDAEKLTTEQLDRAIKRTGKNR